MVIKCHQSLYEVYEFDIETPDVLRIFSPSPPNHPSSLLPIPITVAMAAPKTYQCLSCRLRLPSAVSGPQIRAFSSTPTPAIRKRPGASSSRAKFPNISAKDMGLAESKSKEVSALAEHLRPYTAREKKLLATKYTPAQMKAIEAGEAAIDAGDMMKQGRFRTDPLRIDYIDDFATERPVVDKNGTAAMEKSQQAPLVEGRQPMDAAVTRPGKRDDKEKDKTEEEDPHMLRLSQQTGLTKEQIRKIRVKNLVTHRVVNQTRMGKIQSLYFLTIAGNQEGMLGIGEGKAAEDEDGRRQAMMNAIRNMKPIARYEERTIYGEVEAKVGASVVKLSARPPGEYSWGRHRCFFFYANY